MPELHFLSGGDRAKCKHVYARSRRNIKLYLEFLSQNGEEVGYGVSNIRSAYAEEMTTSPTVPKEVNETLQSMGVIESGSAKPTDWGKVITEALNKRRTALFDDLIIQHMRFFPTVAYTMDIVLDSDEGICVEDINSQLQQESAADSSFQKNSIQNCLNLISDFGIITFEEGTASPLTRSAVATEAIPYAIQLLSGEDSQITSEILREKLPFLLYCQEEDAENLFEEARRRHPIYNYNTRGDRARLQPYGSVFEIELPDTSPQDLLSLL